MNKKPKPTESELEILKILWEKGNLTVRQVHELLSEKKNSGYTTTLKLMQIMLEKGLLGRNQQNKSHIYFALLKEQEAQKYLVNKLVDTVFRGSTSSLVLRALGNSNTSREEIEEIRNFLDKLDKEND